MTESKDSGILPVHKNRIEKNLGECVGFI